MWREKIKSILSWQKGREAKGRAEKEEKGGKEYEWCFKICRCITFPEGHSTHGPLAVVLSSNGERRSQARTRSFITLYHILYTFI